ncbi:MAG: sulfatase, partial [Planctomycetes bacterium]|nr:sulfatase [Planctomycetota bacterium]
KPNILFIIADDLNDSVEGFGGHPQAITPNIDRLASRGVTFINAACNAPLCAPSRPSMLTGLYPHTTGFFGNPKESIGGKHAWDHDVFKKAKTWVQYFKENGYDVHGAGKIDHNYSEKWSDWSESGKIVYGPKPGWGPFPYKGSNLKPGSTDMNFHLAAPHSSMPDIYHLSFFVPLSDIPRTPPNPKIGFEGYTGWYMHNEPFRYHSESDRDMMPDELLAEYAEEFFEDRVKTKSKKPFFLNIGINRPHAPLVAPKKYFDMFPLDSIQLAPVKEDDLDDCAPFLYKDFIKNRVSMCGGHEKYSKKARKGYMKKWTQAYLACVSFADDMIGRVLNALEKSPYAENTLVIFTSDHGYHMGEKLYNFKNSAWEESARVPFVVAGPGVTPGKKCSTPISLVDIYPTIIDYAGLPEQPHPHLPLDGSSIRPLLKEPTKGAWQGPPVSITSLSSRNLSTWGDNAIIPEAVGKADAQIYSIRSDRFRYIICPDGSSELYDMLNDPYAWHNLSNSPEWQAVKENLHKEAEKMTGARLGEYFEPNSYRTRK